MRVTRNLLLILRPSTWGCTMLKQKNDLLDSCLLLVILLGSLSLTATTAHADLSEGLLVLHDFDDLVDGSGNGHDALLGGDAYIEDGLLWLDGDEDYADIGTLAGFGAVNPLVDALSDFTIAVAYASESTDGGEGGSMLVSIGPAAASASADLSLGTNDDGQGIDLWFSAGLASDQSGIGYADGTIHLVILTYETASDQFTFYHLDGAGGAAAHGSAVQDWSGEWDETLDYGIRLGSPRNANIRSDEGTGFFPDLDGQIDKFALWNRALDASEMPEIPTYGSKRELATSPNPDHEAQDVPRDTPLSWSPGLYADTHTVYFGSRFDDVNDADTGSAMLVSLGQTGTRHELPGRLDWGQTHYWRVDEVNAPPDSTVHKGETWNFTVEPFAYPLRMDEHISAVTVSSFDPKYDPISTLNGSGLDANDLHDVNEFNMWLSARNAPEPAWIQYQFDRAYKLHELLVWNYNRFREDKLGYGFKDVLVEYSANGVDFTALDPIQLEPATGEAPLAPATIALNGIIASHVRLTAQTNFKGRSQFGLSEVRLLYLRVQAREPHPVSGAVDVDPHVELRWRPGREAASHEVHLGTDMNELPQAIPVATSILAPQELVLDETYYWQIDEVNNTETPSHWEGDLWHFTTSEFRVVDDFEAYTDDNMNFDAIFQTWIDGLGFSQPVDTPGNNTGSIVGYAVSPFAEQETLHDEGRQSMPFEYDNSLSPHYSEATRTFNPPQDWSDVGIRALTLYVFGREGNGSGQFYVKINGSPALPIQGIDLGAEIWQEGNLDLDDVSTLGVNLQNVTGLTVGIEGATGTGSVFIDDIRLYPSRCIPGTVVGDLTGDCIVDADDIAVITNNWLLGPLAAEFTFESGLLDTSGNMRHGKGRNNPLAQNGVLTLADGSAMDIPLGTDNPFDGTRDFSVAMDFRTNSPGTLLSSARNDMPDNHAMAIYLDRDLDEPFRAEVVYENFRVGNTNAEDDEFFFDPSLWHRLVVTYDAGKEWVLVYLDGMAGEGEEINPAIPNIAADTVRLGATLNTASPNVGGFVGEIDNVRIFNVALTADDVAHLPRIPGIPGDVNEDGIVDQQDKDVVEAHMGPLQRWP